MKDFRRRELRQIRHRRLDHGLRALGAEKVEELQVRRNLKKWRYRGRVSHVACDKVCASSINAHSIVRWCGTPHAATFGDQVVIMNAERGDYHSLDQIGSDIWNRIDQPTVVADLCAALLTEYEADPDVIEADVYRLLGELHDRQLIEVR